MEIDKIEQLLKKALSSTRAEVRQRSLQSVFFKLDNRMVDEDSFLKQPFLMKSILQQLTEIAEQASQRFYEYFHNEEVKKEYDRDDLLKKYENEFLEAFCKSIVFLSKYSIVQSLANESLSKILNHFYYMTTFASLPKGMKKSIDICISSLTSFQQNEITKTTSKIDNLQPFVKPMDEFDQYLPNMIPSRGNEVKVGMKFSTPSATTPSGSNLGMSGQPSNSQTNGAGAILFSKLVSSGWKLPYIMIIDSDEKLLFDIEVKLKLRHESCGHLLMEAIADFPVEALLQRVGLLQAIFDLLSTPFSIVDYEQDPLGAHAMLAIEALTKLFDKSMEAFQAHLHGQDVSQIPKKHDHANLEDEAISIFQMRYPSAAMNQESEGVASTFTRVMQYQQSPSLSGFAFACVAACLPLLHITHSQQDELYFLIETLMFKAYPYVLEYLEYMPDQKVPLGNGVTEALHLNQINAKRCQHLLSRFDSLLAMFPFDGKNVMDELWQSLQETSSSMAVEDRCQGLQPCLKVLSIATLYLQYLQVIPIAALYSQDVNNDLHREIDYLIAEPIRIGPHGQRLLQDLLLHSNATQVLFADSIAMKTSSISSEDLLLHASNILKQIAPQQISRIVRIKQIILTASIFQVDTFEQIEAVMSSASNVSDSFPSKLSSNRELIDFFVQHIETILPFLQENNDEDNIKNQGITLWSTGKVVVELLPVLLLGSLLLEETDNDEQKVLSSRVMQVILRTLRQGNSRIQQYMITKLDEMCRYEDDVMKLEDIYMEQEVSRLTMLLFARLLVLHEDVNQSKRRVTLNCVGSWPMMQSLSYFLVAHDSYELCDELFVTEVVKDGENHEAKTSFAGYEQGLSSLLHQLVEGFINHYEDMIEMYASKEGKLFLWLKAIRNKLFNHQSTSLLLLSTEALLTKLEEDFGSNDSFASVYVMSWIQQLFHHRSALRKEALWHLQHDLSLPCCQANQYQGIDTANEDIFDDFKGFLNLSEKWGSPNQTTTVAVGANKSFGILSSKIHAGPLFTHQDVHKLYDISFDGKHEYTIRNSALMQLKDMLQQDINLLLTCQLAFLNKLLRAIVHAIRNMLFDELTQLFRKDDIRKDQVDFMQHCLSLLQTIVWKYPMPALKTIFTFSKESSPSSASKLDDHVNMTTLLDIVLACQQILKHITITSKGFHGEVLKVMKKTVMTILSSLQGIVFNISFWESDENIEDDVEGKFEPSNASFSSKCMMPKFVLTSFRCVESTQEHDHTIHKLPFITPAKLMFHYPSIEDSLQVSLSWKDVASMLKTLLGSPSRQSLAVGWVTLLFEVLTQAQSHVGFHAAMLLTRSALKLFAHLPQAFANLNIHFIAPFANIFTNIPRLRKDEFIYFEALKVLHDYVLCWKVDGASLLLEDMLLLTNDTFLQSFVTLYYNKLMPTLPSSSASSKALHRSIQWKALILLEEVVCVMSTKESNNLINSMVEHLDALKIITQDIFLSENCPSYIRNSAGNVLVNLLQQRNAVVLIRMLEDEKEVDIGMQLLRSMKLLRVPDSFQQSQVVLQTLTIFLTLLRDEGYALTMKSRHGSLWQVEDNWTWLIRYLFDRKNALKALCLKLFTVVLKLLPVTNNIHETNKEGEENVGETLMRWPPTDYFFSIAIDETESESNRYHAFELLLTTSCSLDLTTLQRRQVWQSMAEIFTVSYFHKRNHLTASTSRQVQYAKSIQCLNRFVELSMHQFMRFDQQQHAAQEATDDEMSSWQRIFTSHWMKVVEEMHVETFLHNQIAMQSLQRVALYSDDLRSRLLLPTQASRGLLPLDSEDSMSSGDVMPFFLQRNYLHPKLVGFMQTMHEQSLLLHGHMALWLQYLHRQAVPLFNECLQYSSITAKLIAALDWLFQSVSNASLMAIDRRVGYQIIELFNILAHVDVSQASSTLKGIKASGSHNFTSLQTLFTQQSDRMEVMLNTFYRLVQQIHPLDRMIKMDMLSKADICLLRSMMKFLCLFQEQLSLDRLTNNHGDDADSEMTQSPLLSLMEAFFRLRAALQSSGNDALMLTTPMDVMIAIFSESSPRIQTLHRDFLYRNLHLNADSDEEDEDDTRSPSHAVTCRFEKVKEVLCQASAAVLAQIQLTSASNQPNSKTNNRLAVSGTLGSSRKAQTTIASNASTVAFNKLNTTQRLNNSANSTSAKKWRDRTRSYVWLNQSTNSNLTGTSKSKMSSSFASASNSLASKTNASSSSSIATSLADKKAPFQELSADMKQSLWTSLLLFKNAFDERDMEDLPPQLVEEFLVAVCQLFRALGQYNSLSSAVQHDACYHVIQEDGITTLVPSNGMLAAMMWTTITTCSHGSSFFRRLLSKYFSSKCFELSPNTGGNTGTSENGFMHYLLNIGINKSYLESTRHLSLQLAGATARDANSINPTVRIALSQLVASHLQQLIHNSQGMMDKSVFFMFVALAALTNAANPVHFESHGPHPTVTNPHMKLMSMHDLLLWAFEKYGNSDEFLTLFYRMLALLSERNATLLTDKLMNSLLESLLEGQEVSSTSLHRSYRQFLGCLTLRQVLQQSEKAKASSKAFVMSTLASLRQEVAVKMAANPNKQRHHEEANEQDKTIDVRAYMSPSKHEEQEFATLTLNEIDFIQVILTK